MLRFSTMAAWVLHSLRSAVYTGRVEVLEVEYSKAVPQSPSRLPHPARVPAAAPRGLGGEKRSENYHMVSIVSKTHIMYMGGHGAKQLAARTPAKRGRGILYTSRHRMHTRGGQDSTTNKPNEAPRSEVTRT